MELNKIIYTEEVKENRSIVIDEIAEGIYVFRLMDGEHLTMSCFVREEEESLCSVHCLTKQNEEAGIKEIALFRKLFNVLEFKTLVFKRSLYGDVHTINL